MWLIAAKKTVKISITTEQNSEYGRSMTYKSSSNWFDISKKGKSMPIMACGQFPLYTYIRNIKYSRPWIEYNLAYRRRG